MKRWMLPAALCVLVFGACSNVERDLRNDSNSRVLNEMSDSPGSGPVSGAATTVPGKERAELLAALALEKETVTKVQKELAKLDSQNRRVAELERKLKVQEEELATLRPLVGVREELDNVRSRINILLAIRQECQEELAHFKGTGRPTPAPSLVQMQQDLRTSLKPEIARGDIKVHQNEDQLTISLAAKALFDSGSADLRREGSDILQRVGSILKQFSDKKVTVTGHTDNQPIKPMLQTRFPSNRELSEARAASGAKVLEHAGVNHGMVSIAGKGESMPIANNTTLEGRAKNRRIEIVVSEGRL